MPTVTVDGMDIRYEVVGSGTPLLLVQGLGAPGAFWQVVADAFAADFECVWYDNPGTGASSAPDDDAAYSVPRLTAVAEAVLDAVGWSTAHVWGGSMGSMVALELALRAPGRVRSLVLGPASCDATSADEAQRQAVEGYVAAAQLIPTDPLAAARGMIPYWYGEGFLAANPGVDELIAAMFAEHSVRRMPALFGPHGLGGWSVRDRLAEIAVPTLVCHGVNDRLLPVDGARAVFEGIPGAELRLFQSAHSFTINDRDAVLAGLATWLRTH